MAKLVTHSKQPQKELRVCRRGGDKKIKSDGDLRSDLTSIFTSSSELAAKHVRNEHTNETRVPFFLRFDEDQQL